LREKKDFQQFFFFALNCFARAAGRLNKFSLSNLSTPITQTINIFPALARAPQNGTVRDDDDDGDELSALEGLLIDSKTTNSREVK
jgi:hypothetical protein